MAQGSDRIIIDVLGNTRPLEKDISRVANQALTLNTRGFSQPLGKISGQLGEFEKSLAASNARVIAFGASAGAIYALQRAFSATIKSVIDVEKALTDINVILNVSEKSLANFGNKLFDIAKNTGLSFAEVAKSAVEFSRQGLSIEDTLKRTSDALILTRLSGLDAVSSVEALTAAINSFGSAALDSTQIVSKLAAVDAAFAVSSADLAEAIKRVGSSASDVGVTFDQLIALVTSAQQITSRGGSVIGNSFKTIFTRLQRPKTLDALEEIGVATKDQEGNILPLIQILQQLAAQYDNLSSVQRAQVAETVGGVFQINILKAALGDLSKEYSIYSRAVGISTGATDEASRRNEQLNQTLSATINTTLVNLQKAATEIGSLSFAPALQKALSGINYVLENFGTENTEGIGAKIGKGLATGLGNFLSGPGLLLGAASLIKIFERLTVFTADAFKQITGLNSQSVEQKTLQTQILNLIGKNPQIIDQINKGNINTANLHQQILTLIEQETVAMQRQLAVANSLTQSLMSAGVRVPASGPMRGSAVKTKSFGFIPNLSNNQEVAGAILGGYSPGQIKKKTIPDYGPVIYNTAEKVKKFPGMEQPAIIPPLNSAAGEMYRKSFEKMHGFNPYASSGFVPNFNKIPAGRDFRKLASEGPIKGNPYEQGYVKLQGELKDVATQGAAGVSISDVGKALGVRMDANGKFFVPFANYERLLKASKQNLEKKAVKRGKKFKGKKEPYALVYPSFTQSNAFQSSGNSEGETIGFDVVPFPGKLKGKETKIIGPNLYKKSLDALVNSASEFLVKLAGVDPDAISDENFKNYLYSNISQDQIGTIVGNAFEGGILASLKVVPEDRSRVLDLTDKEIANLGEAFKINPLINNKYKGGDFKNALSTSNLDSMASKILSSRLNKSYGFIPNFSPIDKALDTEKKMGGSPILDYQKGVGLYVRDRKTQPNFAKVKKDHPEGIDRAIENSFAMQKSIASLGFIPNFAPNPIASPTGSSGAGMPDWESIYADFDSMSSAQTRGMVDIAKIWTKTLKTSDVKFKELNQAVEPAADNTQSFEQTSKEVQSGLDKFRDKALQAAFAVSIVGGTASELAGDNKILANNINGLVQGLGTASTALGLIPGPMGVAAGGIIALYSAASFVAKTFRDNGESINVNLQKFKEEGAKFASAAQGYSDILQKLNDAYKDSKTSAEVITKLNKELVDSAQDIPAQYRAQLLSISNATELQNKINEIQAKNAKQTRATEFASQANEALTSSNFGFADIFGTGKGLNSRGFAKELTLAIDDVNEFAKKLDDSFEDLTRNELISYFEDLGLKNEDLISILTRLNQGDIDKLKTSLRLLGEEFQDGTKQSEALISLREQEAKRMADVEKQTRKANIALKEMTTALDLMIGEAIKSQSFRQNFNTRELSNQRVVGLSKAEGLLPLYEMIRSPESINRTKFSIDELKANEDLYRNIKDIQSESNQSMINLVDEFARKLSQPTEGQEQLVDDATIKDFRLSLLKISEAGLAPKETQSLLFDSISSLGIQNDQTLVVQENLAALGRSQNEKIADLNQEAKKNNQIAKDNLEVQQRILQLRRNIESAGGIEGGINYGDFKSRTIEEFNKNLSNGNEVGLLAQALRFSGGAASPGLNISGQAALRQRTDQIKDISSYLSRRAPGGSDARKIYQDIYRRAPQIAADQIQNLIKNENIGANVDEIKKILEKTQREQGGDLANKGLEQTILQAKQSIGENLVPNIINLQSALEYAAETFAQAAEKQDVNAEISKNTIQKAVAESQISTTTSRIAGLSGDLVPAFEKLIDDTGVLPRESEEILPQGIKRLKELIASGQKIDVNDPGLKIFNNSLPPWRKPNQDTVRASSFGLLAKSYNEQISTLSVAKETQDSATKSLEKFKNKLEEINQQAIQAPKNTIIPVIKPPEQPGVPNKNGAIDQGVNAAKKAGSIPLLPQDKGGIAIGQGVPGIQNTSDVLNQSNSNIQTRFGYTGRQITPAQGIGGKSSGYSWTYQGRKYNNWDQFFKDNPGYEPVNAGDPVPPGMFDKTPWGKRLKAEKDAENEKYMSTLSRYESSEETPEERRGRQSALLPLANLERSQDRMSRDKLEQEKYQKYIDQKNLEEQSKKEEAARALQRQDELTKFLRQTDEQIYGTYENKLKSQREFKEKDTQFRENLQRYQQPFNNQNIPGNNPLNLDGKIELIKPESPLDLNVGGKIKFEEAKVKVEIDEGSNLADVVTPVVENWLRETQGIINRRMEQEIQKLQEQVIGLGARRSSPIANT